MENKYLIALDLDGTLLKDDKTISEETKEYLRHLEKQGHFIVLCSGRAPRTMLKFYEDIGLNSPLISYNGALIHSPHDPKFNKTGYKIDKDFLLSLYKETFNKEVVAVFAENETDIVSTSTDEFLFAFFEKGNLGFHIGDFDKLIQNDQYVYVMKMKDSSDETKEKMYKLVEKLSPKYKIRFWWDCDYSEIHNKEVSKANSLEILRKELGISKDNVIVFGDADNDIEMLSLYENAYLMKNGNPKLFGQVKNVTHFTNEEDGVMKELQMIIK